MSLWQFRAAIGGYAASLPGAEDTSLTKEDAEQLGSFLEAPNPWEVN